MLNKVFVSSTFEDLREHRAIVEASLALSGYRFNGMEHFCAQTNPPLSVCLNALKNSDAFVGILGARYGSCPPGRSLSYTEREYLLARSLKLPIFVFIIDDKAPILLTNMETDIEKMAKLKRFKIYLMKKHNVGRFMNGDQLAWQVLASLRVEEARIKEAIIV